MSRIGRKPIQIPAGVTIAMKDGVISVKGPKGELTDKVHPAISIEVKDQRITAARSSDEKRYRALHGLWRALIQNMILGVTQGYTKKLEIVGV